MVDSVANVLLETLRDVLVEEVKFLRGVSDEVKKVEGDLRSIHALLMEADRERSESPTLKECIAELKELAFKAENVLETYAVEVESKKQGKSLKKKLQRFIEILCECCSVNEIDDIRSRLADITGKLRSSSSSSTSTNAAHEEQQRLLRRRYAHEVEQHFVGMEKDIESLVSMVKDEPRRGPSVISICGMGGLGKTTLVRKVYHHQDLRERFDGRAWVCVTQQFEAETIWKDIFKQVIDKKGNDIFKQVDNKGDEIDRMGSSELIPRLNSVLEQKKCCLIVIDDIWENDHWIILKKAFPMNCKVVLTTRSENVAYQERHLHKLDFLTEDEGWELLGKIALPTNADATDVLGSTSKAFEEIGRQMVQKCGRLPLAISVIGGILRQKQQILGEWKKVSTNIDSYLRRGEGIGNDTGVKLVLDLSYDVLPYYLKPCFLYLACFPEDKEIYTEDLYLLWMGEGLVSLEEKGNNESLRDVAERYFNELAFRCMVQVEKKRDIITQQKFTFCRLHDLMRDLCSSKAEAEKFIKYIDTSKQQYGGTSSTGASIHRIAVNIDNAAAAASTCISCTQPLEDLRSFLVIHNYKNRRTTNDLENIVNFENSKHLRVLVLDDSEFEGGKLPSTIGKLIHMRYLSLQGCNVDELPKHVCDMPYLQTIDLRVMIFYRSMKLPNLIWKMKRLRHLFLPDKIEVIGGDKLRLNGLAELETLENINPTTACITDITNLRNLRKVDATIEEDMDGLSKIVEYMSNDRCPLREASLSVKQCDFGSGEEGRNVVKKMLMSPSLVTLEISDCEIGCGFPCYEPGMCCNFSSLTILDSKIGGVGGVDVVEEFGKYPILQVLWLRSVQGVVDTKMRFGANSFPELDILHLSRLWSLKEWDVEKGAMPKLNQLSIFRCRNLEKLPEGLRFIPTLGKLRCSDMSEEFKARMRRGENGEGAGLDYAKFSHIPIIDID